MKKTLILSAALIGAMSFSMLTGFDSAATPEDVLSKYAAACKEQKNVSADISVAADVALDIPSMGSMAITADADLNLAASLDPMAVAQTGSVSVALGEDAMNLGLAMYMVTEEDGSISMYQNTDIEGSDSTWTKTTIDASKAQQALDLIANTNVDFSSLPISFTLASEPAVIDGTECYELSASLTVEELLALAQKAAASISEEAASELSSVQEMASLFSGIVFNATLDINADDYTVKKIHADMNGSDWSILEALVPSLLGMGTDADGNAVTMGIAVNTLSFDTVYDYASPVNVEVPAEALSAVTADAQDLLAAVENAVG